MDTDLSQILSLIKVSLGLFILRLLGDLVSKGSFIAYNFDMIYISNQSCIEEDADIYQKRSYS